MYLKNGTFLNAEVVKQGYGFAYRYFLFKYFDEFKQYEREAREAQTRRKIENQTIEIPPF